MNFELKHGCRYRAEFSLGLLEQLADNEMIAAELRRYGFIDVHVEGDGPSRHAEGIWDQESTLVPLPAQVVAMHELQGTPPSTA